MESLSLLCSIVISVLKQDLVTYFSFCFLSVLPCGHQERRASLFDWFPFFLSFFFFFFVVDYPWIQSLVESYQRFKKWYLIPPCLELSIIRYGSRVKWRNPGKGVAPSLTTRCCSNRKGDLQITLD